MKAPALIPRSALPPLWREARFGLEAARAAARSGLPRRGPRRRPRPAGAADPGLPGRRRLARADGRLAASARATAPSKAGMRANVDCSGRDLQRLEERLEALVSEQGQRAVVIGQSRGGSLAKVLGRRPARPGLRDRHARLPAARPARGPPAGARCRCEAVARLGSLGRARAVQARLPRGRVLRRFWETYAEPLPRGRRASCRSTRGRRHRRLARLPRPVRRARRDRRRATAAWRSTAGGCGARSPTALRGLRQRAGRRRSAAHAAACPRAA